jgi:benzoate/toluate 1,2-dioxygenase beta subunit
MKPGAMRESESDAAWRWEPAALAHHEAALLDEHRFDEWLELFAEDGLYWVPAGSGDHTDPRLELSIVHDDDSARRLRVGRLKSGRQFAQEPVSRTCHMISGVSVDGGEDLIRLGYSMVVHESRVGQMHVFPGRCTIDLRREPDGLRIVLKKIVLINRDHYIDNLTFLL